MKNRPIDKISLALVIAALCVLTLLNITQTDRPTYSDTENRELAAMPALTLSSLADGSYFDGVGDFFSDTFFARDWMVSVSQKLERLHDLNTIKEIPGFAVIFDKNVNKNTESTEDPDELPDLTLPPELTKPSETDPSQTNPDPGDSSPSEPSEPTDPPIIPVTLSSNKNSLTVGTAYVLTATINEGFDGLKWASSDPDIAYVTDNGDGTATIKGLAEGEVTVTATVTGADGTTGSAQCTVTVSKPTITDPGPDAEYLPNGMFIYNGAAYSQSYFSESVSTDRAAIYEHYAKLFPNATVSIVTAPLATITITDESIKTSDQGEILDKMEALQSNLVNYVNLKNVYLAHADEYLFFKSDHHWTHLGAYYAYYEFALSIGLTPRPLADFEVAELSTTYIGSMANYTGDDRVKSFYDTVNAYLPSKDCTMVVTGTDGKEYKYSYCINTKSKSYMAFLTGDHPMYVINVPENPQDKTILVFKDSFGNAFVPYLTEHYGNIIVIDPRYITMDVYEMYKDQNVTDIVFMYNSTSANSSAWNKYLRNCITG